MTYCMTRGLMQRLSSDCRIISKELLRNSTNKKNLVPLWEWVHPRDAKRWPRRRESNGWPTGPVRLCIGVKLQGLHRASFTSIFSCGDVTVIMVVKFYAWLAWDTLFLFVCMYQEAFICLEVVESELAHAQTSVLRLHCLKMVFLSFFSVSQVFNAQSA